VLVQKGGVLCETLVSIHQPVLQNEASKFYLPTFIDNCNT